MKLKVITLRMKPETGTFDDKELSDFQLDKDIDWAPLDDVQAPGGDWLGA